MINPSPIPANPKNRDGIVSLDMTSLARFITAIAVVLTSSSPSSAELSRRVLVYDGHASLEVPTTWWEIPEELLEFHSLRTAEFSGGRSAEIYQHGFRPGDPRVEFALPQVLIQVRESGRLEYGRFLHLPPLEALRSEGGERLRERAGPLLAGLELEEAHFDRKTYSLRISSILNLQLEGLARVESVSFLTERGLFTVHCYAHDTRVEEMAPVFAAIIDSVRFDDSVAYQPRLSDRWPPTPASVMFGAAALAAAILLLLAIRRRGHR
jgi:hypothetical protein